MIKKITNLIKGNDKENVNLAKEIILVKMDNTNVIAVISLLRMNEIDSILEDSSFKNKAHSIINGKSKKIKVEKLEDYTERNLYSLAVTEISSEDNIKYATQYYIKYINNISSNALEIIEIKLKQDEINKSFEI